MKLSSMYNFCTLFDSKYLSKGLAMYESLKNCCDNFHLYIFPFDEKSLEILSALSLDHVTIIPLDKFEDEKLLQVKKTRTKAEYCWTCTPSTIHYVLNNFDVESCTYLDADIYFFQNPSVLIKEAESKSVIITEHRYTKEYDLSWNSGKYCVQFIYIRNNLEGLKVINWWRDACIEWCYERLENGKFADQKYLDDWPKRFSGVHELKHLGGGVAPWNVQQYLFSTKNNIIVGKERTTLQKFDLVFYHFHQVKYCSDGRVFLAYYELKKEVLNLIYGTYLKHLYKIKKKLLLEFDFNDNDIFKLNLSAYGIKHHIINYFRGNYNLFKLSRWGIDKL